MVSFPLSIRELACLPPSDHVDAKALAANTAESFDVPSGAKYVVFASTDDFYVTYDGTAAVATDITDGTASELNPTMRFISGVSTISVISAASACKVTAAYYGT